jgi:two-component system, NtrC family, response regulator HydG
VDLTKHWQAVMEVMQDGLMVVGTDGTILAVNPAAERLTGYHRDELLGRSCTMLNCTGCQIFGTGRGEAWCDLYRKGRVRAKKCQITDKQNRTVHVLKHASVLKDENGLLLGAVETFTDISDVVQKEEELLTLKVMLSREEGFYGILGQSPDMLMLFELITKVARSDAPVFIQGESGVGKELVARAIHDSSPRSGGPFIKVNCAALNENLLESELFGHTKGAFTGADRSRVGRFEAASGGSIFLDEIGDVPLASQVKLLRVLEEKEIERVGDHQPIPVDVRIITATNRRLEELISQGRFREDLFYRINVVPLRIPSLRERLDDLPILVEGFIERLCQRTGKSITGLTPEAMHCLLSHSWPGNCRELQNAIEYAFVLCPEGQIRREYLPARLLTETAVDSTAASCASRMINAERMKLVDALRKTGGNQTEAAKLMGFSRVTLWKKLKKNGIDLRRDL